MCFPFPLLPSSCPAGRSGEAADVPGEALPRAGRPVLPWPPSPGQRVPTAPQPTSHRRSFHPLCSLAIFRDSPSAVAGCQQCTPGRFSPRSRACQGPRVSRAFRGDGSGPGHQLFPCVRSLSAQRGPDSASFLLGPLILTLSGKGRGGAAREGFVFLCPPPRPWRAGNRNSEQISKATRFSTS